MYPLLLLFPVVLPLLASKRWEDAHIYRFQLIRYLLNGLTTSHLWHKFKGPIQLPAVFAVRYFDFALHWFSWHLAFEIVDGCV